MRWFLCFSSVTAVGVVLGFSLATGSQPNAQPKWWDVVSSLSTAAAVIVALGIAILDGRRRHNEGGMRRKIVLWAIESDMARLQVLLERLSTLLLVLGPNLPPPQGPEHKELADLIADFRDEFGEGEPWSIRDHSNDFTEIAAGLDGSSLQLHLDSLVNLDAKSAKAIARIMGGIPNARRHCAVLGRLAKGGELDQAESVAETLKQRVDDMLLEFKGLKWPS